MSIHNVFFVKKARTLSIQYNLKDSNRDDSFAVAKSNLFLSTKKIPPTAQENKQEYFRSFSSFIMKIYVV